MLALREKPQAAHGDNDRYDESAEQRGNRSFDDDLGNPAPPPLVVLPSGFTESGVIDVTDSFEGMPIDISSPHRNYGEHKEALFQAAVLARAEAEEAAYDEAERFEAAKEALLEEALADEAERQFYEQHEFNNHQFDQAEAMQQHYEDEEAAFQEEQKARRRRQQQQQQQEEENFSPASPGDDGDDDEQQQKHWQEHQNQHQQDEEIFSPGYSGDDGDGNEQQRQQWLQRRWLEEESEANGGPPPLGAFSPEPPGRGVSMANLLAASPASSSAAASNLLRSEGSAGLIVGVRDSLELEEALRQPTALNFEQGEKSDEGECAREDYPSFDENALPAAAAAATAAQAAAAALVAAAAPLAAAKYYIEEEEEELEENLAAPGYRSPVRCLSNSEEGLDAEVVPGGDEITFHARGAGSPELPAEVIVEGIDNCDDNCDDNEGFGAASPAGVVPPFAAAPAAQTSPPNATPPAKRLFNRIVGTGAGVSTPETPGATSGARQGPPAPPACDARGALLPPFATRAPPPSPPMCAPSALAPSPASVALAPGPRRVEMRAPSRIPRLRTRPFAVWQDSFAAAAAAAPSAPSSSFSSSNTSTSTSTSSTAAKTTSKAGGSSASGGDGFLSAFLLAAGVAPAQAVRATAALRSAGLGENNSNHNSTHRSDARGVFGVPGSSQRAKAAGVLRSCGAKPSALKAVFALVDRLTIQEEENEAVDAAANQQTHAAAGAGAAGAGAEMADTRRAGHAKARRPLRASSPAKANANANRLPLLSGAAAAAVAAKPPVQAAALIAAPEETRVDPADGQPYTRAEFVAEYGDGCAEWDAAAKAQPNPSFKGGHESPSGVLRATVHATTPSTSPGKHQPAAAAKPVVAGGARRSKSQEVAKKPRDDPTAWAEKRRLKTEQAKELREAKRFGM
jgi:hypothetical protein